MAQEDHRLLICIPGGPGSSAEVVERLEVFLKAFGESLGTPVTGEYHTRLAECDRYLSESRPSLVLYPLDLFLLRRTSQKLTALAEPVRTGPARGVSRYHLVTASDVPVSEWSNGLLMSPHVRNVDFFTRVVFPGSLDFSAIQLKQTGSAMRALKHLKKGKALSVVLDESEHLAMAGLAFAQGFKTVLSSDALPHSPIAAIGGNSRFRKRASLALTGLCARDSEACRALEIQTIRPVNARTYHAVLKRWSR